MMPRYGIISVRADLAEATLARRKTVELRRRRLRVEYDVLAIAEHMGAIIVMDDVMRRFSRIVTISSYAQTHGCERLRLKQLIMDEARWARESIRDHERRGHRCPDFFQDTINALEAFAESMEDEP